MASAQDYTPFFEVRLELFDGPLDLLLHLVKKRELPIEKVALAEVTGQYLECVRDARYLDLELAGEYLVIASTLLAIKASVLLDEPMELVPDEEGNLVDPHEELVGKLRRLEAFRIAAGLLETRPVLGIDVFAGLAKGTKIDPKTLPLAEHDAAILCKAFQQILSRIKDVQSYSITFENVSVVERMTTVLEALRKCGRPLTFAELIPDITSRGSVIATLIALLELCKRRAVCVRQEGAYGAIMVEAADEASAASTASIMDAPIDSVSDEAQVVNQ